MVVMLRKSSGKQSILLVVLAVLLLIVLSGCSSGDSSQTQGDGQGEDGKTYELKLAHFFPSTHPAEKELVQPWAEEIEEKTGGKVKITSYPGETLLSAGEIYGGVESGVADIGLSCFAYNRGQFPVLEVFELPGIIYESSRVASNVAWEGIKQLNPEEIQGTELMMLLATGPGDLMTKEPVKDLDDLQGMEIRATGLSAKTLEELGATPAAMPQSETYEALSKGVVDGNLGPVEVLEGWKHAEVTEYVTKTPFLYNTLFYITMNKDKWNSLPEDVQETVKEVNEKYFSEVAAGLWDKQNEGAMDFAVNETDQKVIELPEQEQEKWISKVEPVQEDFISKMNEKGLDGEEILNTVESLAEKYNEEFDS